MNFEPAQPEIRYIPLTKSPQFAAPLTHPNWQTGNPLPDISSPENDITCPVIVWGEYTFWFLNDRTKPGSITIISHDSENNWVGEANSETFNDSNIISISIDHSNKTLIFTDENHLPITASWDLFANIYPFNPQYFWIVDPASQYAWTAQGIDNKIILSPLESSDAQLWYIDSTRNIIFSKQKDFSLCAVPSLRETGSLLLSPIDWANEGQQWKVQQDDIIRSLTNDIVSANANTLVLTPTETGSNSQWHLIPYMELPDISSNQFENHTGQHFFLHNAANDKKILTPRGTDLSLQAKDNLSLDSATWVYETGAVVNTKTGYALTERNGTVACEPRGVNSNPYQSWLLTAEGFLHNVATGNLLSAHENSLIPIPYDPLRPKNQRWHLQHSRVRRDISSEPSEVQTLKANADIKKLTVTIKLSDAPFSGTSDNISVGLANNFNLQELLNAPWAGAEATIEIDLDYMFGKPVIQLDDLTHIWIYQKPSVHPLASDAWKLESLTLMVNDQFINRSLYRVNNWIDNRYSEITPAWSGAIAWSQWRDANERPIDYNCETYPVTWLPYISDLKSWRTYDPSTIEGVGLLVGVRSGRLVGELLKTGQTELLEANGEKNSYTWVFTPGGSIIYKYWNHNDKSEYIRHSQLGSGEPVICAGEFRLARVGGEYQLEDVIAMVNDASGHYKPDGGSCLRYVAEKFQALGIRTDNVQWYWKGSSS